MRPRCEKIVLNGKRCRNTAVAGSTLCKNHQFPFKNHTYAIGKRQFSGQQTESPYEEYLQSDHWKARTQHERNFWNNQCALCHRKSSTLHVHHSTYVRLGNEQHGDLIVLCEDCHALFHRHYVYDGRIGTFIPKRRK